MTIICKKYIIIENKLKYSGGVHMHMADALITPTVGAVGIAMSVSVAAYSIGKIRKEVDFDRKIPLMGVVGAFVFAAQMVNFTIPGTGSSGHICGGLLLAAILGPEAGFLSMLSILIIQSLLFGDGGILALGCNAINMGFFGCFIGYKLIFENIIKKQYSKKNIFIGSISGSIVSLLFGAFLVVIETSVSGITELPFTTFIAFMLPIHLVIGTVEGVVTGFILNFIYENRPEILQPIKSNNMTFNAIKKTACVFLAASLIIGGGISLLASSNPDGLEWSILKTSGSEEIQSTGEIHEVINHIQEEIALMPDYNLIINNSEESMKSFGQVACGVLGVFITAIFIIILGYMFKKKQNKDKLYN